MGRVQTSCTPLSAWRQGVNPPRSFGQCMSYKSGCHLDRPGQLYQNQWKFPLKNYFPSKFWNLCRNFSQAIHSRFWHSSLPFTVLMLSRWVQWPDLKWRASTVWSHPPLLPLAGEEEELWNRIITSSLLALELQTVPHVANGLKSLAELPLGTQEASYHRRWWHGRISCSLFIVQLNCLGRDHR